MSDSQYASCNSKYLLPLDKYIMNPKSLIKYLDPYKVLENDFLLNRFSNPQIYGSDPPLGFYLPHVGSTNLIRF